MVRRLMAVATALAMGTMVMSAQTLPASPEGRAQAQFGGAYTKAANGEMEYKGGKWVEITYGRPILRGRTNIFGSGASYGKDLNAGAPVWRAGANVTTRLRTELPLVVGGKPLAAGEYSVFIELKEGAWTLVLSNWAASKTYPPPSKDQLWGSYGYTPEKDVLRVPMKLTKNTMSVEQLTWGFVNAKADGGDLALMWDREVATVAFTVAK